MEDQGELVEATRPAGRQKDMSNLVTTPIQRMKTLARFPLRNLLSKYHVLDAISCLTPEVINDCLDSIRAEPPSRPLTESLASVYINTPRSWLIIRGMIRNTHTDVLHAILDILSDAIVCTDQVLSHTLSHPTLAVDEQELTSAILFESIRARSLVLRFLQRKIQAFVVSEARPSALAAKMMAIEGPLPSPYLEQVAYYSERPLPPLPPQKAQQGTTTRMIKKSREPARKDLPLSPPQGFLALTDEKPAITAGEVATNVATTGSGKVASSYSLHGMKFVHIILVLVASFLLSFTSSSFGIATVAAVESSQYRYKLAPLLMFLGSIALVKRRSLWSATKAFHAMSRQEIPSSVATVILQFQARAGYTSSLLISSGGIKSANLSLFQKIGLTDPQLEDGKVRVKWRCKCGQCLYDDFTEQRPGAAVKLAKMLDGDIERAPTTEQGQPSRSASDRSSSSTLQNVTGFQNHSQTVEGTNLGLAAKAYDPRPKKGEQAMTIISCDPESRWLLVCAKAQERPTSLSQLDICSTTTDKALFEDLRKSYMKLKSRWSRLFLLKRIQSIRFVQFELHIKDFVDIRKVPDMPPEAKRDEYIYQPCDLIPPVGEHLMAHLFHHPEDANERSITCLRAPKKRKAKLTICPQQGTSVGWGLHLVEGWVISRLWLLGLSLFVLGSLVFGVCWAVLQHDVQGAFGVAAYMVALMGLVVGTIQAGLN